MLPLITPGVDTGPAREATRQTLYFLKFCVIAIWFFGLLCTVFSPQNGLCALVAAMVGTALLKDDRHLSGCYDHLQRSPIGSCCDGGDGLSMLMPLFVLCLVNSVLDGITIVAWLTHAAYGGAATVLFGLGVKSFYVWVRIGLWLFETIAMLLAGHALRVVLPMLTEQQSTYQQMPGTASPQPAPRALMAGGSQRWEVVPASDLRCFPQQQQGYTPFSGSGYKLSD